VIRLVLPLAGAAVFFLLSLATVRVVRPVRPRRFFLAYAAALLVGAAVVSIRLWPLARVDDYVGLIAGLLLQVLLCLTMWNAFYSLLWGFSGGLCHDLLTNARLRGVDALVRAYEGQGPVDRILARRLPNLAAGGYVDIHDQVLSLTSKGRFVAGRTLTALRVLSLGPGGGVEPSSHVYRAVVVATMGAAAAAWLAAPVMFSESRDTQIRWFAAALVAAVGGLFFHFVTLPDRSVTLRILVELRQAPNETLTIQQLAARYGVRVMIESRLRQLAEGRFVAIDPDGSIRLLPRGLAFGRFVTAGRRLFRIESAN
jgi:hypothetical protein